MTHKDVIHNGVYGDASAPVPKLRVGFVLVQPFTLAAFACFVDALRLAGDEGDRSRPIECSWSVLGDENEPITSSCGVAVRPNTAMRDPREFDYVVVVGGMLHQGQVVPDGTNSFLKKAARSGISLIGVCTGSFVLARAGLLSGRKVCVSRFHRNRFQEEFPDLDAQSAQMFVLDGKIITCAGGVSAAHLAAHLISKHLHPEKALKTLRLLCEETPNPVNASQHQAISAYQCSDTLVREVMLKIEDSLAVSISLNEICASLGVSIRQLERRFIMAIGITPRSYRLELRLAKARWLVERTDKPVTAIALECGFGSCSHFSNMFKSHFHLQPSDVRRQSQTSPIRAAQNIH